MQNEQQQDKVVFICSPYRPTARVGLWKHLDYAKRASRYAFEHGVVPFTPHLLYPCYLSDAIELDRELGMAAGVAIMRRCDEVWVFGDYGYSEGMQAEIRMAKQLDLPIIFHHFDPVNTDHHAVA